MRRLLAIGILTLTAACTTLDHPSIVDTGRRPAERQLSAEETEAAARARIREIEERILRGDLPKIQFEFDRDEILPESYPTLDRIAEVIQSSERLKLMIFAHCDIIGTDDYNYELSRRRAKSVKGYLANKGIPPPSMRYRGFGRSKPIADNDTDAGRAKNRRVEFYVTTRDWDSVY